MPSLVLSRPSEGTRGLERSCRENTVHLQPTKDFSTTGLIIILLPLGERVDDSLLANREKMEIPQVLIEILRFKKVFSSYKVNISGM